MHLFCSWCTEIKRNATVYGWSFKVEFNSELGGRIEPSISQGIMIPGSFRFVLQDLDWLSWINRRLGNKIKILLVGHWQTSSSTISTSWWNFWKKIRLPIAFAFAFATAERDVGQPANNARPWVLTFPWEFQGSRTHRDARQQSARAAFHRTHGHRRFFFLLFIF